MLVVRPDFWLPTRHLLGLRSHLEIEAQVQDGVFSNGNILALPARHFTLKPAVESTVKSAQATVGIYFVVVAVGRVELVEEELEIFVGILLVIASQGLV